MESIYMQMSCKVESISIELLYAIAGSVVILLGSWAPHW